MAKPYSDLNIGLTMPNIEIFLYNYQYNLFKFHVPIIYFVSYHARAAKGVKFKIVRYDFTYFWKHQGGRKRCKKAYLLNSNLFSESNAHVSRPLKPILP